ncbi:uncharacterized protein LOC128249111 [Octopus bimaculoides]|uniref:uncharacterized protein LOC128249111 n=1 Tax=Octopus bimaculoides TaxID=37653 RepID=UPI0022E18288|nr:uncharacterized protein LOC128249111 [Octopus bimaculoides]
MAYVALSRARKLRTVHLIDLDPSSLIMCDSSAWKEYNYLREHINMEPLPLCNVRLKIIKLAKKATKKSKVAFNMDSEIISLPKSKKARIENTVAKPYISLVRFFFVNSTIQVIRQLPLLAKYMQSRNDIVIREIHDITSSSGTKSVANSRNIIGSRFNNGTQQCAHDFWKHIYHFLLENVKQTFMFENALLRCTRKHEAKCPKLQNNECDCASTNGCDTSTNTTDLKSDLTLNLISVRQQFKSLLKNEASIIRRCSLCGIDTEHTGIVSYMFPSTMRYLVVYLNRLKYIDNQMVRINSELINYSPNKQNIYDQRFRLISSVLHTLASADSGHYTSIVRNQDKWDII